VVPTPGDLDLAIALASDPHGVRSAEAAAREIIAAINPWNGDEISPPIVWRLRTPEVEPTGLLDGRFSFRREALSIAGSDVLGDLRYERALSPCRRRYIEELQALDRRLATILGADAKLHPLREVLQSAYAWRVLAANDVRLRIDGTDQFHPHELDGTSYAELPDLFAPLLALCRTGYVLGDIRHDMIVLLAPPAE
jgi:hypothetical protein